MRLRLAPGRGLARLTTALILALLVSAASASALTAHGRTHGRRTAHRGTHRRHHAKRHHAQPLASHGQRIHLLPGVHLNANQSNNWFGYNQGALEQGGKLFNSISGQWTVPTASR